MFHVPFLLYSWLKEWKLRADREERKKQKDKKQEEGNSNGEIRKMLILFSLHNWLGVFLS